MSDLVAIAYPDQRRAAEALAAMKRLQQDHALGLQDAVAVSKNDEGSIKIEGAISRTARVATGGLVLGALVGLVFFAPVIGALFGAVAGGWPGPSLTPCTSTTSYSRSATICPPAARRS